MRWTKRRPRLAQRKQKAGTAPSEEPGGPEEASQAASCSAGGATEKRSRPRRTAGGQAGGGRVGRQAAAGSKGPEKSRTPRARTGARATRDRVLPNQDGWEG